MPEPDFDQIARSIAEQNWGEAFGDFDHGLEKAIAEQLRQAWNARGAADAVAIEPVRLAMTDWLASSGAGSENVADADIARWRDALSLNTVDR
jgi:hypothetical protein